MAQNWNLTTADRPIVEHAVGVASFDKLRGYNTSLVQAYKALGGKDAESHKFLGEYDRGFSTVDLSAATKELAPSGDFHQLYRKWNMSSHELTMVQRAIGEAILLKIEGHPKSMSDCYKALGGHNHEALEALNTVYPMFEKGKPEQLAQ